MPDDKVQSGDTAKAPAEAAAAPASAPESPQLRRKPDQAAEVVVEEPVETKSLKIEQAPEVKTDEVVPVLPTLVPPYRVEGIGVVDSQGTLVAACGGPHHSLANHLAIANVVCSALNRG